MVNPERTKNSQLFLSMFLISLCFFSAKTKIHAIRRTTTVLIAVPRFDSTSSMPIFPKIDVKAAKTAENMAYTSEAPLLLSAEELSVFFFSIIRNVPVPIRTIPIILTAVSFSPRKIRASIIVSTVLDLSIGVTLFTSPRRKALK